MNNKTALIMAAGLTALSSSAMANDYFFRTKALVSPPQPISLTAVSGAEPGQVATSSPSFVKGYKGDTVSIVGGEYQVCQ